MKKTPANSEIYADRPDVAHQLAAPQTITDESRQQAITADNASALRAEVEKLQAERDALVDRLARLQADFENARKRATREQHEYGDFARADALKSLLPILDSFDRALRTPARSVEDFHSGVELIRKQLDDALIKLGLRPIAAKGKPFDPRIHEAIEVVEGTAGEDNHVLEELQPGYKLGDRMLRPSMVRVARSDALPKG